MKRQVQTLISVVAWVTAVAALGTSVWQGMAVQKHQRLSVRPAMAFEDGVLQNGAFVGLRIMNEGLGPAFVYPLKIHVDKRPVAGWEQALSALKLPSSVIHMEIAEGYEEGNPWRVGYEMDLFGLRNKQGEVSSDEKELLVNALEKLQINFCYCSMYDECREFNYHGDKILGNCSAEKKKQSH